MSCKASGLTALFFGLAAAWGGPASAQAQTFTFEVCNHSHRSASVAVAAHVSVSDERWQAQGWWDVDAGQCSTIGTFPQGWFYYYARSSEGDWHGSSRDSSKTCIRTARFKRFDPEGYTCKDDEKLVSFNGKHIETGGTFTWTLD